MKDPPFLFTMFGQFIETDVNKYNYHLQYHHIKNSLSWCPIRFQSKKKDESDEHDRFKPCGF